MCKQSAISKIVCFLALCLLISLCSSSVWAVSRVLEFEWAVNDSESYDWDDDTDWEIDASSESGSMDIDCDSTFTVLEDNGDNSYDIECATTNVTVTVDNGTPESLNDGSDECIMNDGRGREVSPLDHTLIFPDLDDGWDFGSHSDQTGPFTTIAVDVDDTWTQTVTVTPYGQSPQTMTITCTLLEWTTLGGYNVGKIRRTYTVPVNAYNAATGETMSGSISRTDDVWHSYDEKLTVSTSSSGTGTITIDGAVIDLVMTSTQTIQ